MKKRDISKKRRKGIKLFKILVVQTGFPLKPCSSPVESDEESSRVLQVYQEVDWI